MATLASFPVVLATDPGDLQLLPDMAELVWGIVAFGALLAFMVWRVFPKMNETLDERSALIQGRMEEAETTRQEAEELKRQYEQHLAEARDDANQIVEEARGQAERVRSERIAEAQTEAEQIKRRAREELEAERGRLVQDLRSQVAALSVELAGKIVQRELDPSQHQALVDQYINELSGLN